MKKSSISVNSLHFEDLDGRKFERLVFAYMLRNDNWRTLEWYGQQGSDGGCDIWGVRENDQWPAGQKVCIQCANYRKLPLSKVRLDIAKIVAGPHGVPDKLLVVAGGPLSAKFRDDSKQIAHQAGIRESEAWSGDEFEERLRANSESLLKRFVEGASFPDTPEEIRALVSSLSSVNDLEILALMAELFDRPAFYTPFHQESSIPAFKKAITDTIEALNTGIHRLRDGTEIRRIPSRHNVRSRVFRETLRLIELSLCELRAKYDEYLKRGEIRPCGCNQPDCPIFMISSKAASEMDRLRMNILDQFRRVYPSFKIALGFRQI